MTPENILGHMWSAYRCTSCGNLLLAQGIPVPKPTPAHYPSYQMLRMLPTSKMAAKELPPAAHTYLQQAYDTVFAPDAAGLLASSAVDAMLKHLDYTEGSLYSRIDKAVEDSVLTKDMGKWAHKVRLDANNVRHADSQSPHLTIEDAKEAVEFAEALGDFLFVFTKRIEAGIKESEKQ